MSYENNYNTEEIEKAIAIIYRACVSGKLLTEFKLWEQLNYEVKKIALRETNWIRKVAKVRIPLEEVQEFNALTQEEVL